MEQFIYLLRPARPGLVASMTPEEEAVVEEHFHYLQAKLQKGELYLAGRTTDEEPLGIVVFEAESIAAAREFMACDPAVRHRVVTAELRPCRVALMKKNS